MGALLNETLRSMLFFFKQKTAYEIQYPLEVVRPHGEGELPAHLAEARALRWRKRSGARRRRAAMACIRAFARSPKRQRAGGDGPRDRRVSSVLSLLFSVVPLVALWAMVRYGPLHSRWWRGERPIGFALFVGTITFLAGFVGPLLLTPNATQGPLLRILFTASLGLMFGSVWLL